MWVLLSGMDYMISWIPSSECLLYNDFNLQGTETSSLHKGLEYSQQVKISLIVADKNEWFLRKGYHFPMLATERLTKERKGKDNLNW